MIRTGLLFGSFNPVHIGHIAIAGYMKEFEKMEELWFIVSPQNPYKKRKNLANPMVRLTMLRLAIEEYTGFIASDVEFGMPLPSYTINTLKKLSEDYPERDFHIITGTDNINSIGKWKHGESLLKNYKFLIYPRLNTDNTGLKLFSKAKIADAPVIEVSSSFIRKSIQEHKDMRAFVPSGAYDYIIKNRIYSQSPGQGKTE